jgi:hypothetical protein
LLVEYELKVTLKKVVTLLGMFLGTLAFIYNTSSHGFLKFNFTYIYANIIYLLGGMKTNSFFEEFLDILVNCEENQTLKNRANFYLNGFQSILAEEIPQAEG